MIIETMTIDGHIPVHHEGALTQEVDLVQEDDDHTPEGITFKAFKC